MWTIRQVLVFALLWLPFAPAVGDEPPRRTDAHGDPLPDGVRFRLGSARLRNGGYTEDERKPPRGTGFQPVRTGFQPVRTGWKPVPRGDSRPAPVYISAAALSPDGNASEEERARPRTVQLWDVESGQALSPLQGMEAGRANRGFRQVHGAALSPDGKRFVAGAQTLVYSPDRRMMAVCSSNNDGTDSRVQLWEIASGTLRAELRGQGVTVTAAAFSPDGRTLATGSTDTTVLLWDLDAVASGGR